MRIAFVVHRYGVDILGGSEAQCRVFAEGLARRHQVEVLTTTASDYVLWREGYPAGTSTVNGVTLRRFRVARPRNIARFKDVSDLVFDEAHTPADEERWVEENGPCSPDLIAYLEQHARDYDVVVAFSFRYWTAYHAFRVLPAKVVPFPTAEADKAVTLGVLQESLLRAPAILFETPEEQQMLQAACPRPLPMGEIVGCPMEPPGPADAEAFRREFSVSRPFALYLGRIDANKGCEELFDYYLRYSATASEPLDLLLGGKPAMPIAESPRIRLLGYLTDQQKEDALAAATCLVMPSPYESLSIVLLEAWRRGTATLANGFCDVLRGQTRRSGGGLYYENRLDFADMLSAFAGSADLRTALGASGRQFVEQTYGWDAITPRIEPLFERVAAGSR